MNVRAGVVGGQRRHGGAPQRGDTPALDNGTSYVILIQGHERLQNFKADPAYALSASLGDLPLASAAQIRANMRSIEDLQVTLMQEIVFTFEDIVTKSIAQRTRGDLNYVEYLKASRR